MSRLYISVVWFTAPTDKQYGSYFNFDQYFGYYQLK